MSLAPNRKAGGRRGGLHSETLKARLSEQGSATAVKDTIMLIIF